jgi:hypothetical protein
MNIRLNIVVVTEIKKLSCYCDTQQDALHEDSFIKSYYIQFTGKSVFYCINATDKILHVRNEPFVLKH